MVLRSLPLSEQVRTQILQWIQSGSLGIEEGALPSETEMAEMLNTSRATVREALAQLERERFIIRKQGSGTYINPTVRYLTSTIAELLDPETLISSQGYSCSVAQFDYSQIKTTEHQALLLAISPASPAFRIKILYNAGLQPALWLDSVIPVDLLLTDLPSISAYTPLSRLVYRITGTHSSHSIASLDAVNADDYLANRFCIKAGRAVIQLFEIHLSDFGRPVFLSYQYFNPGIFNLQLLRNSYRLSERFSVW